MFKRPEFCDRVSRGAVERRGAWSTHCPPHVSCTLNATTPARDEWDSFVYICLPHPGCCDHQSICVFVRLWYGVGVGETWKTANYPNAFRRGNAFACLFRSSSFRAYFVGRSLRFALCPLDVWVMCGTAAACYDSTSPYIQSAFHTILALELRWASGFHGPCLKAQCSFRSKKPGGTLLRFPYREAVVGGRAFPLGQPFGRLGTMCQRDFCLSCVRNGAFSAARADAQLVFPRNPGGFATRYFRKQGTDCPETVCVRA